MKQFSIATISCVVLAVSFGVNAQENGVGPTMSSDDLFKRCENGLLFERSVRDPELLTTEAHIDVAVDYTICKFYVAGVFEGARYAYLTSGGGAQVFCVNEKSIDDIIKEILALRKVVPELTAPNRLASQDIVMFLKDFLWKCVNE